MQDQEMVAVLEQLLQENVTITAREVARRHPTLRAVSSITRNQVRVSLLSEYQKRQLEHRRAAARIGSVHASVAHEVIARHEIRLQELEKSVKILTASHVAMVRAVGATGGFRKWMEFYEHHRVIRDKLVELGAMPENISTLKQSNIEKA